MRKCVSCGRKGLFLKLDGRGHCSDCQLSYAFGKMDKMLFEADDTRKKMEHSLKDSGFNTEKKIATTNNTLFVDGTNKKWIVFDENSRHTFGPYDFKDFIRLDVQENGSSILQSNAGNALAGALLFGTVGAIVGASGSQQIINQINSLQIKITINNLQKPCITLSMINNPLDNQSLEYKQVCDLTSQIVSTFEYIKNNG